MTVLCYLPAIPAVRSMDSKGSISVICRECAFLSPDEGDKVLDWCEAVLNDAGRLHASRSPRPATRSSLYAMRPANPIRLPGKRSAARERAPSAGILGKLPNPEIRMKYTDNPCEWKPLGIVAAIERVGGKMFGNDQYHWIADLDGSLVLILEADHSNRDIYEIKLGQGVIKKKNPPLGNDLPPATRRHALETKLKVLEAYTTGAPVRVLLTQNTHYSRTPKNRTKTAFLPWQFRIVEFTGDSIDEGYFYRLERIL